MIEKNIRVHLDTDSEVSIVSIAKNNAGGLEETLKSISSQDYKNWKVIIVVGPSTDLTLEIAHEFTKNEERSSVILQSDSGIYKAMNLGTDKIQPTSKYVVYMNAGDRFKEAESLGELLRAIELQNCGVVIGGYQIQEGNAYPQTEGRISRASFTFTQRGGCHQSMIYSIKAVKAVGLYDLSFPIASDHDLTLRVLKDYGGWKISTVISSVEGNGTSDRNILLMHEEKQRIRIKNFGRYSWVVLVGFIWKLIYTIRKKLSDVFKHNPLNHNYK